ncbi:hypothetical protein J5I95_04210 [Candidatus Poribacteria bacterium]|nr:hypothetical protein [Candidatus Poribacteria bacterium]
MKTTHFFLLAIVFAIISLFPRYSFAQEPAPIVRPIYFLPNDRSPQVDIDAQFDILIKDVQEYFANEMERHGFGRKTFHVETDATGKAVIHHVIAEHNEEYYRSARSVVGSILDELRNQVVNPKDVYLAIVDVSNDVQIGGITSGRFGFISKFNGSFDTIMVSNVLGRTFGLRAVWSRAYLMGGFVLPGDRRELSVCSAKFLDAIPHFNPNTTFISNQNTIIRAPTLSASPPYAIHLQFEISDPDGLQHSQLIIPTVERQYLSIIMDSCTTLEGQNATAEFVTTGVSLRNNRVQLMVVDSLGNITERGFSVNITSVLPPKVAEIPDIHLASAIKEVLRINPSDSITFYDMRDITILDVQNRQITDITGLEHAVNMSKLHASNNFISDVSALADLSKLNELHLNDNIISDVLPLVNITDLSRLSVRGNPMSYPSVRRHIPTILERGVEVLFDHRTYPALVKISGDAQEAKGGEILENPFVVEAIDSIGQPIPGVSVTFAVTAGSGQLNTTTSITDANGEAQTTLTLGANSGKHVVTVTAGEITRSLITFTAIALEESPHIAEDINGDGIVNIQDIILVSSSFGRTGESKTDVNGDGVVNIQDLILVVGALGAGATQAPVLD